MSDLFNVRKEDIMGASMSQNGKKIFLFSLTLLLSLSFVQNSYSQWVKFGSTGKTGFDGQQGVKGQNGRNVVVEATGEKIYLRLRGGDGSPGRDGGRGNDGFNCWQRRGEWNMVGASGGTGGYGGKGGNGGNGGNTTVYYTNIDQLANINIDAEGGRGSFGGRGAEGGRPCFCTYRAWRVRYKDRNGKVFYRDFQCFAGERGKMGRPGQNGQNGSLGVAKLIKSETPLKPVRRSLMVGASSFDRSLRLSQNIWERRRGLLNLIHPNSIVSNDYLSFVKRVEKLITFRWEAQRTPEEVLKDHLIKVSLNNNTSYQFPQNFWVDSYEKRIDEDQKEVVISNMVSLKDLSKILPVSMELRGEDTTLIIKDFEGLGGFVKTEFFIDTNWRLEDDYWEYFKGKVPENLIEFVGDSIHLRVGQLPVRPKSFKKKTSITLRIKRTFKTNMMKVGPFSLKKSKGRPLEVIKK